MDTNIGHIYILQEREFIKTNENVYKIGYTCHDDVKKRIKQYPKGSKLIYSEEVEFPKEKENNIINLLTIKYKLRDDIGREYFEGDLVNILLDIISILRGINYNVPKSSKNKKKNY